MVRAKFYVSEFTKTAYQAQSRVVLIPVSKKGAMVDGKWTTDPSENDAFWEASPQGKIEITMTAKGGQAAAWFEEHVGRDLYIDFTEAPVAE